MSDIVKEYNDCLKDGKTIAEALKVIYARLNAIDEEITSYKMTEKEAEEYFNAGDR